MRLLLDEMLPRRFALLLATEIDAVTVRQHGWASKENGELLRAAQHEFDALLTMDRGMEHQQNLSRFDIAAILLRARSNRPVDLEPLADDVKSVLRDTSPGTFYIVG